MTDETDKPKVKRLDFGKKNPTPEVDQVAEDAIDESIAPLAPSTLTSALQITDDEADKFDDTAPDPEPEPEPEPEPVIETLTEEAEAEATAEPVAEEPVEEPDVVNGEDTMNEALVEPEVDQAEGMDMTEVPVEAGPTQTVEELAEAEVAAEQESIAELEAEKAKLEDQIETRKEAEKQHVCGEIVKVMSQYTVDIDYLAAYMGVKYKRKGSKAKPKYRDPMTGKTWSGRGKTPVWIRGKDFSKFLI